jgi:GT2 family glycosyltransferase
MTPPEISVIVPVYNREADLRALLQDLNAQEGVTFEVIVADDGSTPPLAPRFDVTSYRYPITWLTHTENRGAGATRNTAVAAAKGALLVFIDSDGHVADPGCLRAHFAFHMGKTACPLPVSLPAVLHGRVVGINSTYWGKSFEYSNWFMSSGTTWQLLEDTHAPTHNTSVTRAAFDRVGHFDSQFRVAEDVDWGIRCRAAGIPIVFTPTIVVFHRDRDTLQGLWNSYLCMGEYAVRVRRKHPASRYGFLFPKDRLAAIVLIPALVVLMTAYIAWQWIRREPRAAWYVPGMFIANIAYGIGIWRGLSGRG